MVAIVIGNGTSRLGIDLNSIAKSAKTYGCNALYREFSPDFLIAVDSKMVLEIVDSGYHFKNIVWTNPNTVTQKIPGINLLSPSLGWSSGPTALDMASKHGHDEIYILGFDYEGSGPNAELVNNVYAGSINYKKTHERATYYGNWLRQTAMCINENPSIKYYRIFENEKFMPRELTELQNLFHISKTKFLEKFQ